MSYASQFRDRAKLLAKDAKDLRQQDKKFENPREILEQRCLSFEGQMREV